MPTPGKSAPVGLDAEMRAIKSREKTRLAPTFALCALGIALAGLLPRVEAAEPARPIAPGAIYQSMYRPEGPWAIHVVEADLSQMYLELRVLLGGGATMARRQLSNMLSSAESSVIRPVAGVNGDFFSLAGGSYEGIPLGLHVEAGELISFPGPSRSVFYVLDDGTVRIGRLSPNAWLRGPGDLLYPVAGLNRPPAYADLVLFTPRFGEQTRSDEGTTQVSLVGLNGRLHPSSQIGATIASISVGPSQRIPPDGAVLAARGTAAYALRDLKIGDEVTLTVRLQPEEGRIREALGGGPRLVRGGVASVEHLRERFSNSFATKRHPRTGLGLRDGTLVLVVVDGRQPGYSEGMTLYELAELFLDLRCSDAMNLDGGGSSTMVVRNRVMNSPSSGYERAVVNALGLFSVAPVGPPVELVIQPRKLTLLAGEQVALQPVGIDKFYNPVPLDPENVNWRTPTVFGAVSDMGVFTAAEVANPTVGLITARMGDLSASSVVKVNPAPARVVVTPPRAAVNPGAAARFFANAYDEENQPVTFSPGRLTWRISPSEAGGQIDSSGVLRAPERGGTIAVLACIGAVCGQAEVTVARRLALLEDFEGAGEWSYGSQPPGIPGEVQLVTDPLREGNRCLKLGYDFTEGVGTRTAHAELNLALQDTRAFSVRVLGDGRGCWLRARLTDAAGRSFTVDLADKVHWAGAWREVSASIPEESETPVTLDSIYLAEYHEGRQPRGAIYLDDILAVPPPSESEE